MSMPVGAQDVRQQHRVARVRLASGLPVPLPIPRNRARVNREDREPRRSQRGYQQTC
jgi:hypothetical protein